MHMIEQNVAQLQVDVEVNGMNCSVMGGALPPPGNPRTRRKGRSIFNCLHLLLTVNPAQEPTVYYISLSQSAYIDI